jgi:hypothetical protein
MSTIKITLGGSQYEITQLTLGQLRDLSIGVALPDVADPQETVKRSFDRAIAVIASALRVQYGMTVEKLLALPITGEELRNAHHEVLVFAGLTPATEAKAGEAQAGAA